MNKNFTSALQKKVPGRSQLTNMLAETLNIEKEAVYRRLRGEVAFTFTEVATLAQHLCISLDELIGIQSEKRNLSYYS
ncbi:MAG: hypothetical protein LUH15_00615 [Tannerellaceae bacterium]|nr:hypothetical protein [Tannerellaceae bacterium]